MREGRGSAMRMAIPIVLVSLVSAAGASGAVQVSAASATQSGTSPPPGATAICRDGTFSFSLHRSGTCSHHGGVAQWLNGGTTTGTSSGTPSTTAVVGTTVLLKARTRSSGCLRGPKPDRRCSPGAFYSGLTRAVICSGGFRTSSIRYVPQSEKFAVETEYGMPASYYGYSIEIDHIVPLELGGSNNIANLFPEPGAGPANYHRKDALENRLHDLVCSGALTLPVAQSGIASNWETLYQRVFGVAPAL